MDMYTYIPIVAVRIIAYFHVRTWRERSFQCEGLQNRRWRFAIWRCETTGGLWRDVRIISGLSMLFSCLNLKRLWVRTSHWNSKLRKSFHGSIYSCSWGGYTAGVFNHFSLTLLACCIWPVVSSSFICLAVFLQPAITSTVLCVYCRQPSLPHTPCSPASDLLISPPQPLHLVVCCVLGPWSKTMNIFRNFILETLMQKLTAASWLASTNLKKKEESSSLMKDEEIAPENEGTHTHTHTHTRTHTLQRG